MNLPNKKLFNLCVFSVNTTIPTVHTLKIVYILRCISTRNMNALHIIMVNAEPSKIQDVHKFSL
jgi:hypothetical protein